MRLLSRALCFLVAAAALAGCGPPLVGEPAQAQSRVGPGQTEIVVFAAASLTEPFTQIGADFEAAHPGARVSFSFAGSALLRTQIQQGAPADVYASADLANAQKSRTAGLIEQESRFAKNRLVVVVPADNPAGVRSLADLARPGLKVALAAPDVPAGTYAEQALDRAAASPEFGADFASRVMANVVSREPNVKQALARVRLGEVDAGIVYATDVSSDEGSGRWAVRAIQIPGGLNIVAEYPIAVTTGSRHQEAARAFADYVLSPAGQAVLGQAGFAAP